MDSGCCLGWTLLAHATCVGKSWATEKYSTGVLQQTESELERALMQWRHTFKFPFICHSFEDHGMCKGSDQTLRQGGQWCLTLYRVKPLHIRAVSQTQGSGGDPGWGGGGGSWFHEDGCEQPERYPGWMLWMKITHNREMFTKEGKYCLHFVGNSATYIPICYVVFISDTETLHRSNKNKKTVWKTFLSKSLARGIIQFLGISLEIAMFHIFDQTCNFRQWKVEMRQ